MSVDVQVTCIGQVNIFTDAYKTVGQQQSYCQSNYIEYSIMSKPKYQSTSREHQIKKVDNYMFDLADQIGSGFSSKVYKGSNCQTGTQVAIKVVELKKLANEVEKTLLANQSKALNVMNHPNILRAQHSMQTINNFYIVTQLFQQNLEKLLQTKGVYTESEIIEFLKATVNGLAYLQQEGIIHRDIKPSNILVGKDRYVIGDFGFCHFMSMPCLEKGFNVGSPFYMSPEAYKFCIYSCKSDVWALGISVLQLLAGRKPFNSLNFDSMVAEICQNKYYRQLNISENLKKILDSMLQFDLEKRINPMELLKMLPTCDGILTLPINDLRNTSDNQRQINFKNTHKRRISPHLNNQQNLYSPVAKICTPSSASKPLTQRKKVNFGQSPKQRASEVRHHSPPNPKFIILESLSKQLLIDANLTQNAYKLKLLRILAILPQNQFPAPFIPVIEQLQVDDYFNHVLQTTDYKCIPEISHYLCFLIEKVLRVYQAENTNPDDENLFQRMVLLEQALSLWRANNPKVEKPLTNPQIMRFTNLQRAKSKSTGNLNSGLRLLGRE